MAGVLIENSGYLWEILRLLGAERWNCNWLITELECYDHCGWDGCEKWAEDAERQNRRFHQTREIADCLVRELGYGGMSPWLQTNLYGSLWRGLYRHQPEKAVCEDEVRKLYCTYMEVKENHHG